MNERVGDGDGGSDGADLNSGPRPMGVSPGHPGPGGGRVPPTSAPLPGVGHGSQQILTRCVECGYDLRGLSLDDACPECGTPVRRSQSGNLLQNGSAAYLASLRRGIEMVLWSIVLSVLVVVVGIFVAIVAGAGGGTGATGTFALVASGLDLAAMVLGVLGWWAFTTPDPRASEFEGEASARKILRFAVAAGAVLAASELVLSNSSILPVGGVLVAVLLSLAGLIVWAVQYFASMQYIMGLAPRIPDASVYTDARRYRWLLPLLGTVGIVLLGLGPLIALLLYYRLLRRVKLGVVAAVEARRGLG